MNINQFISRGATPVFFIADSGSVRIVEADKNDFRHQQALVCLINVYLKGDMGEGRVLDSAAEKRLVPELFNHPGALVLFAEYDGFVIGLAVCFIGFSTFYAKKLINIHDLVVLPEYRNNGVAERILSAVEAKARELDCCKITLEVRTDNDKAMLLYKRLGFDSGDHPMYFWRKVL